jgi:hypothetical protein
MPANGEIIKIPIRNNLEILRDMVLLVTAILLDYTIEDESDADALRIGCRLACAVN